MATLVIKNPDGTEQEHDVAQQLTIGRADGNDLVLVEGGVSRNHARFFVQGEDTLVEDVGSSNGTWVDGRRIDGPVALTPENQVVIGDYEVAVKKSRKPRTPGPRPSVGGQGKVPRTTRVVPSVKGGTQSGLSKRSTSPSRAPGPQLRGLTGGVTGKVFKLNGTMLVGRVAGTDLTIDDDSVSRKHAELEVQGREVVLRDLGSANGTTVNGAPIAEDTPLSGGDIVQFGVVELMFETNGSNPNARASASPRRTGTLSARRSRNDDFPASPGFDDAHEPMDPRRKRLVIIVGSVITVLIVAVLGKALTADPDPIDKTGRPVGGGKTSKRAVSSDPAQQIDDLMTECRAYSSTDRKPDWKRAEAACEKVRELEPIHADALLLLKKIQVEKACEENLEKGRELAITGQVEAAIEAFSKVGAKEGDCPSYALRALTDAREPVAEVKKLAGRKCKDYSTNQKWDNAYKQCEVYIRLACQQMDDKDLYAPALLKLKLDGPLTKGDWRPADPLYINFLKARERVKPGEPLWRCPVIPVLRPPRQVADPYKAVKAEFASRFKVADMGEALTRYFDGRTDAALPLQKILENMNKSEDHEAARALLTDIQMAQNLFTSGLTEITNDKPERAEAPFRKALDVDETLVLPAATRAKMDDDTRRRELEKRASFVRRTITETMASTCYLRGKTSADRKDLRQACRMWKLGASFNRSNIDLLRALSNQCTRRAEDLLAGARSCEQLQQVIEFAVDGDGLRKKAEERMASEDCRIDN